MSKKILSVIISIFFIINIFCFSVFAEEKPFFAIQEGTYYIMNEYNEKYLQVSEGKEGEIVSQGEFSKSEQQKWVVTHTQDGYITIKNSHFNDKMLGIGNSSENEKLKIYYETKADSQKFKIENTFYGSYIIRTKSSNHKSLLSIDTKSAAPDSDKLDIFQVPFTKDLQLCYLWDFIPVETIQQESTNLDNEPVIQDGLYFIVNKESGKYLQVLEDKEGEAVTQGEFSNSDNQKWYIKNVQDGYVVIQSNLQGKKVFTIEKGLNFKDTQLKVYTSNESDAQKFKIDEIYYESSYSILTNPIEDRNAISADSFNVVNDFFEGYNDEYEVDSVNIYQMPFSKYFYQMWEFIPVNPPQESPIPDKTIEVTNFQELINAIETLEQSDGGTIYIIGEHIKCTKQIELKKKNAQIAIRGKKGYTRPILDFSNIAQENIKGAGGIKITGSGYTFSGITLYYFGDFPEKELVN